MQSSSTGQGTEVTLMALKQPKICLNNLAIPIQFHLQCRQPFTFVLHLLCQFIKPHSLERCSISKQGSDLSHQVLWIKMGSQCQRYRLILGQGKYIILILLFTIPIIKTARVHKRTSRIHKTKKVKWQDQNEILQLVINITTGSNHTPPFLSAILIFLYYELLLHIVLSSFTS